MAGRSASHARLGRHERPRSSPRGSRWPPAATCASPPVRTRIRCGASRRAPTAPGSCRAPRRPRRASSGSPVRCGPPARSPSTPGALRALLEGRSLLPAGVTATRGRFDRGDTVSVLSDRRGRGRPRHRRLLGRRRGAHHGAPLVGDRRAARVSRPRRDDPSRRPGAAAAQAAPALPRRSAQPVR